MSKGFVFSWAEDVNGKMVHVDNVPNGLNCKCFCPHCHEQLLARHGDIRGHGFAHHSENRGANLEICYMVVLYKLAEHILQTKKRIRVPSYYDIYKEKDLEFTNVVVDGCYERVDKQPDVIATTKDNQQYLIEFAFQYKVYHKKDIDYHNLSCLEIDLSGQTLESLESFLMNSKENRRWVNNANYFNQIESTYHKAGKSIKVVPELDCYQCELRNSCCSIKVPSSYAPIRIENNGQIFRMCKVDEYYHRLKAIKEHRLRNEQLLKENEQKLKKQPEIKDECFSNASNVEEIYSSRKIAREIAIPSKAVSTENKNENIERSCFDCENNLGWANKNGMANCGIYGTLRIAPTIAPNYAKECDAFKRKS